MDFLQFYNAIEAAWWMGLGVFLAIFAVRPDSPQHRRCLATVLIMFGVSDLIEIQTGAWWKPWWLAVVKFGCGFAIGMLVLLWIWSVRRRDVPSAVGNDTEEPVV